ncbi:hypothetical protein T492DRAFT_873388, partial [Pavlovales sp. CCMP2436]
MGYLRDMWPGLALVIALFAARAGAGELTPAELSRCAAVHQRPIVPFRTKKLPRRINPREVLDLDLASTGGALTARNASAAVSAMSGSQRSAWERVVRGLAGLADGGATGAAAGAGVASPSVPELRVLVFGGSMLAGGCCDDRVEPRWSPTCTYAKRMVDALARNYRRAGTDGPGALPRIEYQSLAAGGTTTEGVLPSLPALIGRFGDDADAGMPTLLLFDYSVNDAWE